VSLEILAAGPDAYAVLIDDLLLDCGIGVLAGLPFAGPPLSRVRTVAFSGTDPAVRDPAVHWPDHVQRANGPNLHLHGSQWQAHSLDAGVGVGWMVEHAVEGTLLHVPRGQLPSPAAPYSLTVPNPAFPDGRPPRHTRRIVVTGGSRSGKSAFAERLAQRRATSAPAKGNTTTENPATPPDVLYVATGPVPDAAADPEWDTRVAAHRQSRPAGWDTIETQQVAALLDAPGPPLFVDGLGTWLTAAFDTAQAWQTGPEAIAPAVDALTRAFAHTPRDVVLVTDEVGDGVVPATHSGRLFRDALGHLNAAVADAADAVWRVTAGQGQRWR